MTYYVAVVSGGLDSTSFMASKQEGDNIVCLTFEYGQKATRETEALKKICLSRGIPLKIIDITFMKELWKGTQLTDENVEVKKEYEPSVVVPIRNGVMLMIALSYAYTIKADMILYGSHLGDIGTFDHNGHSEYFYPDCSPEFAHNLAIACKTGMFKCSDKINLTSPAIEGLGKADLVELGQKHLGDLMFKTWSCYENGKLHCGKCESCINRQNAFKKQGISDKTDYAK